MQPRASSVKTAGRLENTSRAPSEAHPSFFNYFLPLFSSLGLSTQQQTQPPPPPLLSCFLCRRLHINTMLASTSHMGGASCSGLRQPVSSAYAPSLPAAGPVSLVRQPLRPLESFQFDDAIVSPMPTDSTNKWRQAEATSPLAREPHDAGIDLDLDLHRLCLREDRGTSGSNRPSSSHLSATRSNSLRHNRQPLSFHESILYRQRRQSDSAFVDGDEQAAPVATVITTTTDVDEDGELAGLWASSPPFRPMSAGHMSNLSSCSDDSGVLSVASSRSVSESDDGWGDLGLSVAAPIFTPTNYDTLPTERPLSLSLSASPAPFLVGGPAVPARLNPPTSDVGSGVSSRPASSLCSEAGDVVPVPVPALSEDGLELTQMQIKHALPEWMCAEVCELKRKKTRRGCRGHRRNRKKREEEDAAPAGMSTATMGLPMHALGQRSSPVPGRSQDHAYADSVFLKQQQQHYMGSNGLQHMQAVPVFIPSANGGFIPTMALQPVSWQRGHFASEGHNFVAPSTTV